MYYLVSGYWKENELTFDYCLATSDGNYDYVNCPYPHDRIFLYGFDPKTFDDSNLDFVITKYTEIKTNTTANYFTIYGYWKDDKSEFSGIVKDTEDIIEEEDDYIFFYGLSENDIKEAIQNGEEFGEDFVITDYSKHEN